MSLQPVAGPPGSPVQAYTRRKLEHNHSKCIQTTALVVNTESIKNSEIKKLGIMGLLWFAGRGIWLM